MMPSPDVSRQVASFGQKGAFLSVSEPPSSAARVNAISCVNPIKRACHVADPRSSAPGSGIRELIVLLLAIGTNSPKTASPNYCSKNSDVLPDVFWLRWVSHLVSSSHN